jgi:hypothetical protein
MIKKINYFMGNCMFLNSLKNQFGAIITKVGIFVLLALIAIYYEIKLFRNIKGDTKEP